MIPYRSSDLSEISTHVRQQVSEIEHLLREGDMEHATWQPDETSWSLVGHVAHMAVVNEPYVDAIEAALDQAPNSGSVGSSDRWKHPAVSIWFVRQNEPPPRLRIRTFKAMNPDPGTTPEQALSDIGRTHERLLAVIESARGRDLGRIRFGSPFLPLLRLSVGTAIGLIVAHTDRHIWLMREVNQRRGRG